MNPLVGIAFVLVVLGVLLTGVKRLQRRGFVDAETARKCVHLGMGSVCVSFQWIFHQLWPVWALAALAVTALGLLRCVPWLRREIGGVLHDVNRASFGELYFPV